METLAVLCVAGVLAAVAMPAARSFGQSAKLSASSGDFLTHLHLARSEAIKRRTAVVMCKSSDGQACGTNGGWEQGWIVFQDRNGNGARDPGEALLQHVQRLPAGFRLRGNLNVARYVSFVPSGATRTAGGAFQAGTITACFQSPAPTEARQIVINAVGRPRVQKVVLPDCG